jgi:UDP-glucuronate 4-epimerase
LCQDKSKEKNNLKLLKRILITGAAGFIGFHLTKLFLAESAWNIVLLDSINDYYDVNLKPDRLKELGFSSKDGRQWESANSRLTFVYNDLSDKSILDKIIAENNVDYVIHLAAQAGVRYSLENPDSYVQSNLIGFVNLCESIKTCGVKQFVFASSSSVYGVINDVPFNENDNTSRPVSLYGATKKANEVIAHSYAHLYNIPTVGLRFFTVYGEWGRPDMAYFSFSKKIISGEPIKIFNNGELSRDFTYVADIVKSIKLLLEKRISDTNKELYSIFNIGNSSPIKLLDFIEILERHLGEKAVKQFVEMQDGDVYHTYADVNKLSSYINFKPETSFEVGIANFTRWYKEYYKL